jgi:hypothetical protein
MPEMGFSTSGLRFPISPQLLKYLGAVSDGIADVKTFRAADAWSHSLACVTDWLPGCPVSSMQLLW